MEQRKLYESNNLLVTDGICVLGDLRIAVSSIATVAPETTEEVSGHWNAALILSGIGVVLIGIYFGVERANHAAWIIGAVFVGCALWTLWQIDVVKSHTVTITLNDGRFYTVGLKSAQAAREFANRISEAVALR